MIDKVNMCGGYIETLNYHYKYNEDHDCQYFYFSLPYLSRSNNLLTLKQIIIPVLYTLHDRTHKICV